jgi:DNA gyrase subunit B
MNNYAKSAKMIKDGDSNLTGEDVREGLTAVIHVYHPNPQFEGQTKGKLGNPEVKGLVESAISDSLKAYLEQNPGYARKIVEKGQRAAQAREAARRARDLVQRKGLLEGSTLPGKLSDCSSKDPAESEIYIVEGISAGGTTKSARDRHTQAVLPLRGKVLNVEKARLDKMLKSEQIHNLITALGTNFGTEFAVEKLRYHKVVIMTDADVDGAHIRTLLLTFFFRHMPELIEHGYLYIAQPPLYLASHGRTKAWLWSNTERDAYVAKQDNVKVNLQRYKGLGEMNAEQLWDTTLNPETRSLSQVQVQDAEIANIVFEELMGTEVPPRKAFIMSNASEATLDV